MFTSARSSLSEFSSEALQEELSRRQSQFHNEEDSIDPKTEQEKEPEAILDKGPAEENEEVNKEETTGEAEEEHLPESSMEILDLKGRMLEQISPIINELVSELDNIRAQIKSVEIKVDELPKAKDEAQLRAIAKEELKLHLNNFLAVLETDQAPDEHAAAETVAPDEPSPLDDLPEAAWLEEEENITEKVPELYEI